MAIMESCPFLEEANALTGHLPPSDREEVRYVCAAVLSLYHDQIMPLFRRVRRRCAELAVGLKDLGPEGDGVFFSDLITRFPSVFVGEDPQSLCPKTGIFLIERPVWFHGWVCVHVARSSFPMVVWVELHAYIVDVIRRRARDAHRMKGGRYGMSWCLRNLAPSCVSLFSLGKLCHLIQFGIQLGMLKFKHDFLLPVATCPVGTEHDSSISRPGVIATLPELHFYLQGVLKKQADGAMYLSQLKCALMFSYKKEISPTVFGFSKLSDLILVACHNVCRLYRYGSRQVKLVLNGYEPASEDNCERVVPHPERPSGMFPSSTQETELDLCKDVTDFAADPMKFLSDLALRHSNLTYAFLERKDEFLKQRLACHSKNERRTLASMLSEQDSAQRRRKELVAGWKLLEYDPQISSEIMHLCYKTLQQDSTQPWSNRITASFVAMDGLFNEAPEGSEVTRLLDVCLAESAHAASESTQCMFNRVFRVLVSA
ncbi:MAG: hypothetical protein KVP17_001649 [Porospora cf. gigantea B]|uniref:uncharacterized protein n=2 Tax=Porospora cf. gigantea B TaxID=2853592 RepID=UPI0035719B05|nr:MAG: hypothetical protein KVP17_001649 [Porospora cf. gigantea B]